MKPGIAYRHRPGVYALLPRGGRLLVTFQQNPEPEFQLPGGGVDAGESPLPALHREVFEETGWHIARPRRIGAYRRFTFMPDYDKWAEKLCHIYVARPVRRHDAPTEPGHSARWLPFSAALAHLTNDAERAFAARWLQI